MTTEATEKNGQEVTQPKEVLEKIIGEMIPIVGDLMVAEVWLKDGWDGTLVTITHVIPVLERTISSTREAVEKVLALCYKTDSMKGV